MRRAGASSARRPGGQGRHRCSQQNHAAKAASVMVLVVANMQPGYASGSSGVVAGAQVWPAIEQDLALGQLIFDLRSEAGLSQRELAGRWARRSR